MKKIFIIAGLAIVLLFSLIIIRTFSASYVKISGEVICDSWEGGSIEIYSGVAGTRRVETPPISQIIIYKPGYYSIKVPKNIGKIIMHARYVKGKAVFVSDVIDVGTKNIRLDMALRITGEEILMKQYKGQTIMISGEVFQDNFKEGFIAVGVYSEKQYKSKYKGPDIAKIKITQPGKYSVEVPANLGDIYILAVYVPPGYTGANPQAVWGEYKGNPLNIKSSDIENADIAISN